MKSQEVKIRKHIQRALRRIGIKSNRKNLTNTEVRMTRNLIGGDKKWFREILSGWSSENPIEICDNEIIYDTSNPIDSRYFYLEKDRNLIFFCEGNTVINCSMHY